jgi:hypothetical protein
MYKKFKDFDLRNLFCLVFVKKLNYVLIFKTIKRNLTRNQGCCFHTFNVPEELKSKYAFIAGQYSIYV